MLMKRVNSCRLAGVEFGTARRGGQVGVTLQNNGGKERRKEGGEERKIRKAGRSG
jgi:hypothetical protein